MALNWKQVKETKPIPGKSTVNSDCIGLSISPSQNAPGGQYQHLLMSFGVHSERSHEECLESWPREVLKLARKALDDFEAKL